MPVWIVSLFTWRNVALFGWSLVISAALLFGGVIGGYAAGKADAERDCQAKALTAENKQMKANEGLRRSNNEIRRNGPDGNGVAARMRSGAFNNP